MLKEKKSFFERLAGSISVDDEDESVDLVTETDDSQDLPIKRTNKKIEIPMKSKTRQISLDEDMEESDSDMEEGELSVDVYQTPTEIIIEAMVAGVKPEDIHLSITREMEILK